MPALYDTAIVCSVNIGYVSVSRR